MIGGVERAQMIEKMIELKYVPCSTTRTLQRYMDTDAKSILIEDTL